MSYISGMSLWSLQCLSPYYAHAHTHILTVQWPAQLNKFRQSPSPSLISCVGTASARDGESKALGLIHVWCWIIQYQHFQQMLQSLWSTVSAYCLMVLYLRSAKTVTDVRNDCTESFLQSKDCYWVFTFNMEGYRFNFLFYFHYSSSKQSACVDCFSGLHRLDGCLVPLAVQWPECIFCLWVQMPSELTGLC